jgi:hypothetical protein
VQVSLPLVGGKPMCHQVILRSVDPAPGGGPPQEWPVGWIVALEDEPAARFNYHMLVAPVAVTAAKVDVVLRPDFELAARDYPLITALPSDEVVLARGVTVRKFLSDAYLEDLAANRAPMRLISDDGRRRGWDSLWMGVRNPLETEMEFGQPPLNSTGMVPVLRRWFEQQRADPTVELLVLARVRYEGAHYVRWVKVNDWTDAIISGVTLKDQLAVARRVLAIESKLFGYVVRDAAGNIIDASPDREDPWLPALPPRTTALAATQPTVAPG